jgi:hypothetical protein
MRDITYTRAPFAIKDIALMLVFTIGGPLILRYGMAETDPSNVHYIGQYHAIKTLLVGGFITFAGIIGLCGAAYEVYRHLPNLTLTDTGLLYRQSLFLTHTIAWREIGPFILEKLGTNYRITAPIIAPQKSKLGIDVASLRVNREILLDELNRRRTFAIGESHTPLIND